ncbi:MAG: TraB/GumN family protein [Gammaproteobacteria bacterium]|nr:MAG: TraB/GumN family protein [Gammaproteobacteria bacterium]
MFKLIKLSIALALFSISFVSYSKSFLWEIKDKDNSVFLLGSVHLLRESDFPLNKSIINAFESTELVVFEADISALSSPKFQYFTLQQSMLPKGQTLKTLLPPDLYKTTAKKMLRNGIKIEMMHGFKPWMAALNLQLSEFNRLGYKPEYGVDQFLYRRAQMKGKQTRGLETPEFQIALFSELSSKQQVEFLAQTIKEMDKAEKMLNDMLKAWKVGDAKAFYGYNIESFKMYPELMNKLLINRNKNWIPKIVELINSDQNAMVVVGSLHLPGKDGVLDLLSKKGYKAFQH